MYTEKQLLIIGARFIEGAMIEWETSSEDKNVNYEIIKSHVLATYLKTFENYKVKSIDVQEWWKQYCNALGWGLEYDGEEIPDLPPDLIFETAH